MAEYTYKDIIIDPESEEAKNAVGKEIFFDNIPQDVVCMANMSKTGLYSPEVMKEVIPGLRQPFRLESGNRYACIIVKKEPSYTERSKQWIEENNLKVGDYVKVLRKTELYENRWGSFWVDEMSDYIGKALKVLAINSLNGLISLECDDTGYDFPYFILEKTESPKPKYVPFESAEEFVERYTKIKKSADFGTFNDNLFQCGMWIRNKHDGNLHQVVSLGMNNVIINFEVDWEGLFDHYEFLNGSPCGKLVEVNDERLQAEKQIKRIKEENK